MTAFADWLRAHRSVDLRHDWAPIRIERDGHLLELDVSADAARIVTVRANIGARSQQLLADVLDAMLPTPLILAERHRQRTVTLKPHTFPIETTSAAEHSAAIDRDLANDPPAVGGVWLVSDVGKSWTICRRSSPRDAFAEGMFLDGTAPHDIFGPTCVPGVLAVRVPGAPEALAGHHNLVQGDGPAERKGTDYSQKALFVRRACTLDGAWTDLAAIYADPVLWRLVSSEGPLPARHPGVELLSDAPEWKELNA